MVSPDAIDRAVSAHGRWRKRLEEAIATGDSELTVASIRKDTACELGQWLRSLPVSERSTAHYRKVLRLHADFHTQAAEILHLALRGAKQEASARLGFGRGYTLAAGNLMLALSEWRNGR